MLRWFPLLLSWMPLGLLQGQPLRVETYLNHNLIRSDSTKMHLINGNQLHIQLAHPQPDSSTYACRLSGYETDWTTYQQRITLAFTDLPGGTYYLLIRMPGGVTHCLTRLNVKPQLWQRWWFLPSIYLFALLLVATSLYFSYLYRLHQQVQMQQARDRIARDLHDDMGSYLSSISILSAAMPTDPARARQNLDRIGQTARQVMDAMSDIVWSINPAHDTMQQVVDRMKEVANELFGTTDTAMTFAVDPGVETLSLPLERRRDFFLIYKEAITNAARYAHATQVAIGLVHQNGQLRLTIADNGQGFDPAQVRSRTGGGNGQGNMQVRAAALSGTLQVCSEPGAGTRVLLIIPV